MKFRTRAGDARAERSARACQRAVTETLEARQLLSATSLDIQGVQAAAFDQPRINAFFRFDPKNGPLVATDPTTGDSSFNVTAFLDTGTSEVLLSQETSSLLGINPATYNGQTIEFSDTGVAGSGAFNISDPLYFALASSVNQDIDNPVTYDSVYNQQFGPIRAEVNPFPADETIGEPLDILGMPGLQGKVMVVDARPLNDPVNFDFLHTYIYNPGTPYNPASADNPGILPTSLHVQTSQADFSHFVSINPAGAPSATLDRNPFIGPDPVKALDPNAPKDTTPPVSIGMGNYSGTGSFLFDSGAAASFISQNMAAKVHVHYKPGTYASEDPNNPPDLVDDNGKDLPNQFSLQIGGIGGTITAAGFFLDSMTLPTTEGGSIRYLGAPVLVLDISVENPATQQVVTLDGDFGMNYLVASTDISNGGLGASSAGAFDWFTYDQTTGLMGFAPATPTASAVVDRHVFYNNSKFDGNNAAATSADDSAIATDKSALLPGQTATFANYTSYSKGINGVMIDLAGPHAAALSASDFTFRIGNDNAPGAWAAAPAPTSISVIPGDGTDGFDRVKIIWADGAIKGKWLQVTTTANANTGLAANDVFYFGNAVGESGNSPTNAAVTSADALAARGHQTLTAQTVTSVWDYNRDGAINTADVLVARGNQTAGPTALQLIATPATAGVAAVAVAPALSTMSNDRSVLAARRAASSQPFSSRVVHRLDTLNFVSRDGVRLPPPALLATLSAGTESTEDPFGSLASQNRAGLLRVGRPRARQKDHVGRRGQRPGAQAHPDHAQGRPGPDLPHRR